MIKSGSLKSSIRHSVILVVLLSFIFQCGCEPLRKKFIRKKKKADETSEFVPILDPIDYPPMALSKEKMYRHHYSLWKVWHRDLVTVLEEKGSDKRSMYIINQMLIQMGEIAKLIPEEKQALLLDYSNQLQRIAEDLLMPSAVRNNDNLKKKVLRLGKNMRAHFRFKEVESGFDQQSL